MFMFGVDIFGSGVFFRVGLKFDDLKENDVVDDVKGEVVGVGVREVWEGGVKEKMDVLEFRVVLELLELLEYGGGFLVTELDDFKDEELKENTVGVLIVEGKEKVEVGVVSDEGVIEIGVVVVEVSSFCGVWEEVGVEGVFFVMENMEKKEERS